MNIDYNIKLLDSNKPITFKEEKQITSIPTLSNQSNLLYYGLRNQE